MATTADPRLLPPGAKCFRLRRYYLVVGVVCALYFAAVGVVSTLVAFFNADVSFARPVLAALLFGVFWSGFMLLAVWVIAAYFRERLLLTPDTISQHGIFRSRTLPCGDVHLIKWRRWPRGGSLVVRTSSEKITIHLDNFTTAGGPS